MARVQALKDRVKTPKDPPRLRYDLEMLFEEQRLKHVPSAPSRMLSQFVCPAAEDAKKFSLSQPDRTDVIYLVEPTEALTKVFVARWDLFKLNDLNEATTIRARRNADRYWSDEVLPAHSRELLISCPIKIVRKI